MIDAIATRLLDRVVARVVAAMKEDGPLPASGGEAHLQLTLADAYDSDELAVDALRDALGATEIDRPTANAIVWDLTS